MFRNTTIRNPFNPPAMRPFSPLSQPMACRAANRATFRFASETNCLPPYWFCCPYRMSHAARTSPVGRTVYNHSERYFHLLIAMPVHTFRTSIAYRCISFEHASGWIAVDFYFRLLRFRVQINYPHTFEKYTSTSSSFVSVGSPVT